jgi:hypothetical protein
MRKRLRRELGTEWQEWFFPEGKPGRGVERGYRLAVPIDVEVARGSS